MFGQISPIPHVHDEKSMKELSKAKENACDVFNGIIDYLFSTVKLVYELILKVVWFASSNCVLKTLFLSALLCSFDSLRFMIILLRLKRVLLFTL